MTYQHKFLKNLSCTIVSPTNKGFRVEQTEKIGKKVKTTTQFYNKIDFCQDKGFWIKNN